MRKYNALVKIYADEQYRLDLRSALIRLDMRNMWGVGDSHPNAWELDELLPPRGGRKSSGDGIELSGNSPEAEAWFAAFRIKCSIAMAEKKWPGPEMYPMPS